MSSALTAQPGLRARTGHTQARHKGEQGPRLVPERALGWAMAGRAKQPPSARRKAPAKAQAQSLGPSTGTAFATEATRVLIYKNRDFFIFGIGMRCMHHRTLLIALITMVCSDPTDSNAFVGDSNRKFEALQPPGTRCAGRYPVQMYWAA